jgi:hypothetical protein
MLYRALEARVDRILSGRHLGAAGPWGLPTFRGGHTRVYLVRQPTRLPGIDHVALLFDAPRGERREVHVADHGPATGNLFNDLWVSRLEVTRLPGLRDTTIDDVREFEAGLTARYVPFLRDCRHHVMDVLDFCYPPPPPPP